MFQRPGPGEHPLQFNYAVWFSRKSQGKQTSSTSYDQNLKLVGTFASVSSFSLDLLVLLLGVNLITCYETYNFSIGQVKYM